MSDPTDDIFEELDNLPPALPPKGSFIDDDDYYDTFPEDEAFDKVGDDDPFW